MFKFNSRVRYSEIDETGHLSVPKAVDYFQDCSNFQSDALGIGREYLEARNLAWVLSFWQIVFHRRPKVGEVIWAGTFPYEFKGFMGLRNFLIMDELERPLISANSVWTLLNMQTGRPVKVSEEILSHYQLEQKLPMEYASRKVTMPEQGSTLQPRKVEREHLDTNHHMNNAQFIAMAMNYIPAHLEISELRVEYKKQAFLGDDIYPFVASMEGGVAVSLRDKEGIPYVNIHILTIPGGEVL